MHQAHRRVEWRENLLATPAAERFPQTAFNTTRSAFLRSHPAIRRFFDWLAPLGGVRDGIRVQNRIAKWLSLLAQSKADRLGLTITEPLESNGENGDGALE